MQTRSENPFRLAHWTGLVDSRPFGLFRIALGIVLLQDLWARSREISTFLTDDGILPRGVLRAGASWGLFNLTGEILPVIALFIGGTIVTLAFTVGYRTRVATGLAWVFFVSLHRRVPPIQTGGDSLIDILLFFGFFTNLGARWSLDARRKGIQAYVRAPVPRFMQYIPAVLYLYTARAKLLAAGTAWLNGPILYQHLHLHGWVRPAGVLLGEHPGLCAFLGGATIVVEFLIPVLMIMPVFILPARALATLMHLGLQLGILLTLKVGIFTNVMLACTALWLQPEWLDALSRRLPRKMGSWLRSETGPAPTAVRASGVNLTVQSLLAAVFALVLLQPIVPRHLPQLTGKIVKVLELDLKIGLFTHAYPSVRWETSGLLADGQVTDPFPIAAPHAYFGTGFRNSQWIQLPERLDRFEPLGRFVCQRYNESTTGTPLRRWTLVRVKRSPFPPDSAPPAEVRKILLNQECPIEGAKD
jgi:hypothetical protein